MAVLVPGAPADFFGDLRPPPRAAPRDAAEAEEALALAAPPPPPLELWGLWLSA